MVFLGFISGKTIRFPGKCAKTLKNPGSLTSTQSLPHDPEHRVPEKHAKGLQFPRAVELHLFKFVPQKERVTASLVLSLSMHTHMYMSGYLLVNLDF